MALPGLIEIVPAIGPIAAEVTVPGSKSITNRALVLAALARGKTRLLGALWSEDTQVMVGSLQRLGFSLQVLADPEEASNRTITVEGLGGTIPEPGIGAEPLELFVGNAGTAARFLAAVVCLGHGTYRLLGTSRMQERPQAALFRALRELGYCIDSPNDKLPALIHGSGPQSGACCVSIAESSQFASALLLGANVGKWSVRVVGENPEESPYVAMTAKLCARFPSDGGPFQVEPDASSGSYFWAAGNLLNPPTPSGLARLRVANWPVSGWQIDEQFPRFWPLPASISRQSQLGDSILTAMVMAPFAPQPTRFTDLGRLRMQECERVRAMRTELSRCGAKVVERGDTLEVFPSQLHEAEIETYNDHRLAMCFAILGLKVPSIKIKNPACVKKTFPNFFQKLAVAAPAGLGATIRDASTGRILTAAELFAD